MRRFYTPLKLRLAAPGLLVLVAALAQSESSATFLQAMHAGMKQMDRDMASARMTGRPDHDFAAMMIPHHQGAIEMAKVELLYGRDPVMRRLAQEILVDQQSEIDAMQLWIAKRLSAKTKRKP